jgi:hypothetical protein
MVFTPETEDPFRGLLFALTASKQRPYKREFHERITLKSYIKQGKLSIFFFDLMV